MKSAYTSEADIRQYIQFGIWLPIDTEHGPDIFCFNGYCRSLSPLLFTKLLTDTLLAFSVMKRHRDLDVSASIRSDI